MLSWVVSQSDLPNTGAFVMRWLLVADGHYKSSCGRWVILFHLYAGWVVYDLDEFVDVFDSANEAMFNVEQALQQGWDDSCEIPKSA
jgi:hypothetical protein